MLRTHRDFASNVGIAFHTPEEYFLHEQPVPFTRFFEPGAFLNRSSSTPTHASMSVFSTCYRCKRRSLTCVSSNYRRQKEYIGHSPHVWQSSLWQINVLLDQIETAWLRTYQPGYLEDGRFVACAIFDLLLMQDRQRDKCLKVASEMLGKMKSVAIGTLPSCFKPSDRGKAKFGAFRQYQRRPRDSCSLGAARSQICCAYSMYLLSSSCKVMPAQRHDSSTLCQQL